MRFRLLIAYDGGAFHGWQRQAEGVRTVEGVVTEAVATITGGARKVQGASRTDAGVHAYGQVATFDYEGERTVQAFYRGLNHLTPADVAIRAVDVVDDGFHARHSARGKQYRYQIRDAFHPDPLSRHREWHVGRALDAAAMHEAAQALCGKHDFTSFRAAGCDANSPVRELYDVSVRRSTPTSVEVVVVGSAFLKYMVRAIAGTLVEVGRGRRPVAWVGEALAAQDRSRSGPTAPACGLTLERIFYPDHPPLVLPAPGELGRQGRA